MSSTRATRPARPWHVRHQHVVVSSTAGGAVAASASASEAKKPAKVLPQLPPVPMPPPQPAQGPPRQQPVQQPPVPPPAVSAPLGRPLVEPLGAFPVPMQALVAGIVQQTVQAINAGTLGSGRAGTNATREHALVNHFVFRLPRPCACRGPVNIRWRHSHSRVVKRRLPKAAPGDTV